MGITTMEDVKEFEKKFMRYSKPMLKAIERREGFERNARQKRALDFTEDEIWKGVKHHGMDRTKI